MTTAQSLADISRRLSRIEEVVVHPKQKPFFNYIGGDGRDLALKDGFAPLNTINSNIIEHKTTQSDWPYTWPINGPISIWTKAGKAAFNGSYTKEIGADEFQYHAGGPILLGLEGLVEAKNLDAIIKRVAAVRAVAPGVPISVDYTNIDGVHPVWNENWVRGLTPEDIALVEVRSKEMEPLIKHLDFLVIGTYPTSPSFDERDMDLARIQHVYFRKRFPGKKIYNWFHPMYTNPQPQDYPVLPKPYEVAMSKERARQVWDSLMESTDGLICWGVREWYVAAGLVKE